MTVMEFLFILMEKYIKASDKKVRCMVKEELNEMMEADMKVIMFQTKEKDLVFIDDLMGGSIVGND